MMPTTIIHWLDTPTRRVLAGVVVCIVAGFVAGLVVGNSREEKALDRAALAEALLEKGQVKLDRCERERVKALERAAYDRGRYETLDSALRFARSERAGGIGPVGGR